MEKVKDQNIKTIVLGLILSFFVIPLFSLTSFATSVDSTKVDPITGAITDTNSSSNNSQSDIDKAVGLPPVTMNEMTDLVEQKTYDVVHLLQVFVKPFAVICFIGCGILSLIGALGKKGYVGKGLLGMFISGMMYTAVLYAPEIVQFFSTWLLN